MNAAAARAARPSALRQEPACVFNHRLQPTATARAAFSSRRGARFRVSGSRVTAIRWRGHAAAASGVVRPRAPQSAAVSFLRVDLLVASGSLAFDAADRNETIAGQRARASAADSAAAGSRPSRAGCFLMLWGQTDGLLMCFCWCDSVGFLVHPRYRLPLWDERGERGVLRFEGLVVRLSRSPYRMKSNEPSQV